MSESEERQAQQQRVVNMFLESIRKNAKYDLSDSIADGCKKINEAINDSVPIKSAGYTNTLLSIGSADKAEDFASYGFSNDTLNFTLWTTLYNSSWVFKRAIDKPAQDEVRAGITLTMDSQKADEMYRIMKKYRSDFIQLFEWGALYGGAIAVMLFDNIDDKEYEKPMNYAKLKKSKTMRMYVVDRWYGVAPSSDTVTDMNNIDFGKPKYYDVTLADGKTLKFHHDYVLRYEHRFAPKLIKNGMLQGWGYAEGSHILNELSRDDKLKSSIQSLVDKALIEVIKMSGMRGVFMGADADNEAQLRKRLEMVNWGRSFNSLTFLDKEDEYEQNTFSGLTGLADLLQNNMWLISSALEMQGILFGDLKGGFSQDEEALERYDETINNRCENFVRPVYEKFLAVQFKIHDIEEHVEFTFNSLLMKKQDKEKVEALKNFVDLLSGMLGDGVITLKQYAKAIQAYSANSIIDFNITDEDIDKLDDKMNEEMENIDLS